jgi:hypothetical protein
MDAKSVGIGGTARLDRPARPRTHGRIREILKVAVVQALILVAGFAIMEFSLREFLPLPVHGGVYVDRSGRSIHVALDEFVLRPNLDVTHRASEFSKRIRTTDLGYRWVNNASLTPDYLFLGDSFTFGHGVADDETFADLFCVQHNVRCQNLGRSGTGTFDQKRILRYAIEHDGMRPANVVLVMLAACWIDAAGNDLGDNLRGPLTGADDHPAASGDGPVRVLQRSLGDLEIVKRGMLALSGPLKGALYRCSDAARIDEGVAATKTALAQLQQLATEYHFKVTVVVVHPYQELDGHYVQTEQAVRRATPDAFRLIFTGADFRKNQYYPYDGHLNVAGHRNMAAILDRRLLSTDVR